MSLFRPSELLEFLRSIGARPKKSLSQNFLVDGNIVQKIVRASIGSSRPLIVEIGPGAGVLTEAFLEKGLRVVAVEKDEKLARALSRLDSTTEQLEVFSQDIRSCSLPDLIGASEDVVVVSSLPYHITRSILEWFILFRDFFSRSVIVVQDEVAQKLLQTQVAPHSVSGDERRGRDANVATRVRVASLAEEQHEVDRSLQPFHERNRAQCGFQDHKPSSYMQVALSLFFDLSYLCRVRASSFYPAPKVDSAVLVLDSKKPLIREKERQEAFLAFVATAFSHKRKVVRRSLLKFAEKEAVEKALLPFGLNIRPEEIRCDQWIELFCALEKDFLAK